jgi:hypothetical protein
MTSWLRPKKQKGIDTTTTNDKRKINEPKDSFVMNDFCTIYKTTPNEVKRNPKIEFRYICFQYIPYIKNKILPPIHTNSKYEAVLVEFRKFPHVEFLIRNAILKLGTLWSYTIVCGSENYEFMVELCLSISPQITISKTEYANLSQIEYNSFLKTTSFWKLLEGEKILLYQEDSLIFKDNIDDFMMYDYIGAPWSKTKYINRNNVGNGGLSVRNRRMMIYILNTFPNYSNTPEDIYFSSTMLKKSVGCVASWKKAYEFSSEEINNNNSFGGHAFWINNSEWKKRVDNLILG